MVEKVQCINCIHLDYDTFEQPFCDLDNLDMDPEELRICRQFYPYPIGDKRKAPPVITKPVIIKHDNSIKLNTTPPIKNTKNLVKMNPVTIKTKFKTPEYKVIRQRRQEEFEVDIDNTIKAGELHVKLYKKEIDVDTFKSEMKKLNFCDKDIEEIIVEVTKVWGVILNLE